MISENKFSKYLLYAVGEIVLVVIGILIALSINNWNNRRQERQEEIKYLNKLKVDLEVDVVNLEAIKEHRLTKSEAALTLLEMETPNDGMGIRRLDSLITLVFGWREYIARTNTLEELTSSGKLSILRNDSIKTNLLRLEDMNRFESTMSEHMKREYHEYLYDRAAMIRERDPMQDYRESFKDWKYVSDTSITEADVAFYCNQADVFLHDLILINGLKLAAGNNLYLSKQYDALIVATKHLIGFIDQDLDEEIE